MLNFNYILRYGIYFNLFGFKQLTLFCTYTDISYLFINTHVKMVCKVIFFFKLFSFVIIDDGFVNSKALSINLLDI